VHLIEASKRNSGLAFELRELKTGILPQMIRVLDFCLKRLLVTTVVLAVFCVAPANATVETYTDQAVPPEMNDEIGQPLSAGDLTMQDVLLSLPRKKIPPPPSPAMGITQQPLYGSSVSSSSIRPIYQPPASNSAGTLLMQGMGSVYGVSVAGASSLHAPGAAAASVQATDAPTQVTNIAKGVSVMPLPDVGTRTAQVSSGGCISQSSNWVKTCSEAGYPDNYVGQIRGETRTACPAGSLQDVWVSNTCVPPDNGGVVSASTSTALTSPSSQPSGPSVDGSCGSSNGLATNARPMYQLCNSGLATAVSGEGPWRWSCQGASGGMTVSCAAPVGNAGAPGMSTSSQSSAGPMAEDAVCGTANNVIVDIAPTIDLCAKGAASRVNGSGPWTWACSGTNGGRAVSCTALKKIDGICGAANSSGSDHMPMAGLCDAGYASAVTGNGPWAWTCSGLNGGQAATCSASPRVNAVCGPASLSGLKQAPTHALCSAGEAGAVNGNGPWNWQCFGMNGGATVGCQAHVSQDGACGTAHGSTVAESPTENLCSSGMPSRVTGSGPWNWTCAGLESGNSASCVAMRTKGAPPSSAPKPGANDMMAPAPLTAPAATVDTINLCGTATELVAIEAPSKNLCKSGTAGTVSGRGPWNWTCSDNGQQSTCSTLSLSSASLAPAAATAATAVSAPAEDQSAFCGSAAGQGTTQEPASNLCSSGKPSSVAGTGPWTWTCTKGKNHVTCQSDKTINAVCGASNGTLLKSLPVTGLCSVGTPTQVEGNGPWVWSCVGSGGGASISCSAAAQSQARIDGNCGVSSNTTMSTIPSVNLCDSGVASAVYGEGPWTWTCSGLNGGLAASCSAQKNTPPAPPPPGPPVNGLCGSSNGVAFSMRPTGDLCETGIATSISGDGPWNWSCIGQNSGMTVSCTAPLQPPAPISGVCGGANGVPTMTTPRSGLCSAGISSAVSGQGPWTWSCSGVNGGGAVGCVAPLAGADVGSLPSMTTPSAPSSLSAATIVAPHAPKAQLTAPTLNSTASAGLVTPRLPSGSLPPLKSGNLPPAPQMSSDMSVPAEAPQLPADEESVPPPPVRDLIQPAPALHADLSEAVPLPGNHFVLDASVSTIPFAHGSDNFDANGAKTLDKLTDILLKNSGVRITLTAYADNTGSTPRDARRLSLSRALAVRDYLTSRGVSSARIDVRALGANIPSGPPDRVDIKAN
jgi:outer membrane protein OmpA-like peptidoglycan-associated protein